MFGRKIPCRHPSWPSEGSPRDPLSRCPSRRGGRLPEAQRRRPSPCPGRGGFSPLRRHGHSPAAKRGCFRPKGKALLPAVSPNRREGPRRGRHSTFPPKTSPAIQRERGRDASKTPPKKSRCLASFCVHWRFYQNSKRRARWGKQASRRRVAQLLLSPEKPTLRRAGQPESFC